MRAALLSYSARSGDALGNQLAEKLSFFLERGADVRVFVEDARELHPALGSHCQALPTPGDHDEGWAYLLAADLIVVDYSQHSLLLGLLPLLADAKPRVLFDYHGVTPAEFWSHDRREALEKGAQQRGLVWCADAALVHSRFMEQELTTQTGYPADRVSRHGLAVDLEQYSPGASGNLKQTLGIGAARLLLFVGRLAPNKRISMLVEAVAGLRTRVPAVHAALVGDDGDVYHEEAERCRQRADELGVADRLHFLGRLKPAALLDAYRSADALVMPSRHEGFCLPVIEAMACGTPVLAARATALPETVAFGGLTFTADDPADLCRQLRRVFDDTGSSTANSARTRIAVVSFRYGTAFAVGAETSLRAMAEALRKAGHAVEVFTTCTTSENDWSDQLPEGRSTVNGVPVHRFRIDPHDRTRHIESVRLVSLADGPVSDELEIAYLTHSIHSSGLLDALRRRETDFDAIVVGPYLFGLTYDVATAFPRRTLLVPCFHDESFARLRQLQDAYERVGGVLYHSEEEQHFAEAVLGLNHPNAVRVGTLLELNPGDAGHGRRAVKSELPYVLYAGRYSQQKELLTLLSWARRYSTEQPNRFKFAFLGHGEVAIPKEPWARDLGFVDDDRKRDLLAGAALVVQMSRRESLSLVALEAWAQGVPVLANRRCDVLVGQLSRCGAGDAVDDYEEFAAALDDLWQNRGNWRDAGERGRAYVRERYGSAPAFVCRLLEAVRGVREPLVETMRRRGRERALEFGRGMWREQFAEVVERVLHAPARLDQPWVEVRPRVETRSVAAGSTRLVVPVRVINRGTTLLTHEGPGRSLLRTVTLDEAGIAVGEMETSLPALLLPERSLSAAVVVEVPATTGRYRAVFRVEQVHRGGPFAVTAADLAFCLSFTVEPSTKPAALPALPREAPLCAPMLDSVQAALAQAERRQRLPDGYLDVSTGYFGAFKRWLKRKLLGNFQRGYVDVLARQQTAFNQQVLVALAELSDCCATLNHATRGGGPAEDAALAQLKRALADVRRVLTDLETRVDRLEAGATAGSWLKEEEIHS